MDLQDIFDSTKARHFYTDSTESRQQRLETRKGFKYSEESRAKMSASKIGKAVPEGNGAKISAAKMKPIMSPLGMFPGRKVLAEAMGVHTVYIGKLLKKFPDQYYYVKELP